MPITEYLLPIDKPMMPGSAATTDKGTIWRYRNGEANRILYFGLGLFQGTATDDVITPAATGGIFEGVSFRTDTIERKAGYSWDNTLELMGYPTKHDVSVWRSGMIWVLVDSFVTRKAPVFVRHTEVPGTTGIRGCFRTDADAGRADPVPYARFYRPATAPVAGKMNIAVLDLRMPN